jgi:hypothetical protein
VHIVVSHLRLRDPVTEETKEASRAAVQAVVDAGGLAAHVASVDERHLILMLVFASHGDADRIAREIGEPWMREHIVPLLDSATERSVGEVFASAQA